MIVKSVINTGDCSETHMTLIRENSTIEILQACNWLVRGMVHDYNGGKQMSHGTVNNVI